MTPKTPPKTPFTLRCEKLSPLIACDDIFTPLPTLSPSFDSPLKDCVILTSLYSHEWRCPETPPALPETPSKSPLRLIVGTLVPIFNFRIKKKREAEPPTIGTLLKYGTTFNNDGVRFSMRFSRRNVKM